MTRLERAFEQLKNIRLGDEPVYAEDLAPPKPKPKPKPKKKRKFRPSSEPSQGRLQYAATAVKRLRNA
mgnify:CR=1 FL=1